jgi:CBS domain-containing protein
MSKQCRNLCDAERCECLTRLRDARALILRDAESFHEAAIALERVGQVLCGKVRNGLGGYKDVLLELAGDAADCDPREAERLFGVVKDARNLAAHEGAWARHLSSRLVDFLLILEDSIQLKMNIVKDIMVRNPLAAEPWHLVSHVRHAMLANSFSHLPIFVNSAWHTVSDLAVMRFLRNPSIQGGRNERLSKRLDEAIGEGLLEVVKARNSAPESTVQDVSNLIEIGPVLVIEDHDNSPRLVGILTAFDLL